ncbi:MAG: leucine-rich repeat protein, partial [Clostridia bacterium]|nr:leucine-rich repeat protein [Clostridia bacterium]
SFDGCSNVTALYYYPDELEYWDGDDVFDGIGTETSGVTVTFGNGVKVVPSSMFYEEKYIKKVNFSDTITTIGSCAFEDCTNLQNITIPSSVKTIGSYAFQNCTSFTSITIPANVEKLYHYSFDGCSNVTALYYYPDELEYWDGDDVFDGIGTETSGVTVTFGEGVKVVPSSMFYKEKYIKKVIFRCKNTLTTIGGSAFDGCTGLTSAIYCGSSTDWSKVTVKNYNTPLLNALKFHTSCSRSEYKVTRQPTCLSTGTYWERCNVCETERNGFINPLGHTCNSWTVSYDPTCVYEGLAFGYCERCGVKVEKELVALGHSFNEWLTVVDPTCETAGSEKRTCGRCGKIETNVLNALGHTFGDWFEYIAPTCEEKGEMRRVCSACNEYETKDINAIGHSYKAAVTAPTCEEGGYTTYTCSNCGDIYIGNEKAPLGHKPGAEATCEKDQICRVCNKVLEEKFGHDYDSIVTEPTCEKQGYTTHTCSICQNSYKDSYTDALGHKPGEEATCTTSQVCTVCNKILKYQLGHTLGEKATCTTDQICTTCNAVVKEKLGHKYTYYVIDPTCEKDGGTEYWCIRCPYKYFEKQVDALGHTPKNDATCTIGQYCKTCNKLLQDKLGHDYIPVITEPDCENRGYTTNTCSRCEHKYKSDYTDALGHDYDSVVTEPDCENRGYTTHTCSHCGDEYTNLETSPLGHKAGDWIIVKEAEIGVEGLREKHCERCGELLESERIEALKPEFVKGDVNGNGVVDAKDYALAKRHCLKTYTLSEEMLMRADLNGNGKLEASEYGLIKRHVLGTFVIK